MTHIVLLGDSTLDNHPYVGPGEEVESQLRARRPKGWSATLLARDGAVLAGVHDQLARVPAGASHLIVSAGGNDALHSSSIIRETARSTAAALLSLADVRDRFAVAYRRMLDAAVATALPVAISTIYDVRLPDPEERRAAITALTVLNDVILREAATRRLPVLDLRTIFDEPADFANPIEPSGQGGAKIAERIVALVSGHDFAGPAALYA